MKAVLLFALVGLAAANHYPGHVDFPASYGFRHSMPAAYAASADEPMVIVTKTSHFEPELVAIVVERGINYLPESFVGLRNMLSEMDDTVTLCKSSRFGAIENCFETPITKVLAPETFSAIPVGRVLSEMPWYVLGRNNIEIFDMPMLTSRANEYVFENAPVDSLKMPIAFAQIKSPKIFAHEDADVDAVTFRKAFPVSYFNKDAFVNSYPLRKASPVTFAPAPLSVRKHVPAVSDALFETTPLRSAHALDFVDSDALISSYPVLKSVPISEISKDASAPNWYFKKANTFNVLNHDGLVESFPLRKATFDTSDSLAGFYPFIARTQAMPFAARALPVHQHLVKSMPLPLFAKKIVA